MKQGPYILDADNKPLLVSHQEYAAWVRSLQASEEWRWGGKAFETLFLRCDWLPSGTGAINTVFDPYSPVDDQGPLVFETTISLGTVVDGRFADVRNTKSFQCGRYHTREQAVAGHDRLWRLICSEGINKTLAEIQPTQSPEP